MNHITVYRLREFGSNGTLIVILAFPWNTEITLVRPQTKEVRERFFGVEGLTLTGNVLQFTAVKPFLGERYEHTLGVMPDDVRTLNLEPVVS
jgi:hypothetical protein